MSLGLGAALLALGLGAADAAPPAVAATVSIPMQKSGGVYVVPVSVDGLATTFDCIVDSGATDVNIPDGVFRRLVRDGSLRAGDYLGTRDYTLADGSTQRGRLIRLKSLKVGGVVVTDVVASVGGDGDSGLLGQSFFERFATWSLDNTHHTLVLVGPPSTGKPERVAASEPPSGHPGGGASDTTSQTRHGSHGSPRGNADVTDEGLSSQNSH